MPRSHNHSRVSAPVASQETINAPAIFAKVNGEECYIVEVDDMKKWEIMTALVCLELNIPAPTTRKGLKKVHADFDDIYTRIETMYRTCPPLRRESVRGGIAMILIQLFVDSILLEKLFQKGVLNLIFPLLESPRTRQLALQALSGLCEHPGFRVEHAIAEKVNYIARFIRNSLDDYKLACFGVTTIAHCLKALVTESAMMDDNDPEEFFRVLQDPIDVIPILDTVLESVKRHHTHPTHIVDQVIDLLSFVSIVASDEYKAHPQALRFLVAGLRSKDWDSRGKCLAGIVRLHIKDSQEDHLMDPRTLLEFFKHGHGAPAKFNELFEPSGVQQESEIITAYNCVGAFYDAISEFRRTKDLLALAMREADLIPISELSIAEGLYVFFGPNGPIIEAPHDAEHQVLYSKFTDSLPICAQALRERKDEGDEERADILDVKSLLLKRRTEEAVSLAEDAIKRNPDQAFFYYAVSQSRDCARSLKAAQRGLECQKLTPSLRWLLLERTIHCAGWTGIQNFIQGSNHPGIEWKEWKEAVALLEYAYEKAKLFIETAPPDSRLVKQVGYWLVLLTMVMEENLSPDLRELNVALEAIALSEKFWQMIDVPSRHTELYLAHKTALEHFDAAQAEFAYVFEASDKSRAMDGVVGPAESNQLSDALVSGLADVNLDNEAAPVERSGSLVDDRRWHIEGGTYDISMALCTWCSRPSAALRKCYGCGNVQYCDKTCQKAHWMYHKQWCKYKH